MIEKHHTHEYGGKIYIIKSRDSRGENKYIDSHDPNGGRRSKQKPKAAALLKLCANNNLDSSGVGCYISSHIATTPVLKSDL